MRTETTRHRDATGLRAAHRALPLALLALAATLLLAPPAAAEHDSGADPYYGGSTGYDDYAEPVSYDAGYSYVRNLDGDATLIQAGGDRDALELNQPVLVGDRVWVSPRGRAEMLLSDGNLLRLDGGTEVAFDALAHSPDARDRVTVLRLLEGNAQLVVFADALGDEPPRVELPNATVYVGEAGRYRLTSDRGDWSQVVVRAGRAEVATVHDSRLLRAGDEVLVDGYRSPRTLLRQASSHDGLERWGERLDHQVADDGYVDPSLRHAAAPLDDYGTWVTVEHRRAWSPRVGGDWRPYTHGRWTYTPSGLTWVSAEPWGWVPYHYGTWDYVAHHGWVWFPGRAFAPAWVYWYWGPEHVAWVPVGYYSRHYRHRYGSRIGLRFGVYGWFDGGWGLFDDWVVCPTRYFGHRRLDRYAHDGRYWHRRYGDRAVPRGIITTDTRPITPNRWQRPDEVMRVLRTRPGAGATGGGSGGAAVRTADLPDATPFVARRPELPSDLRHRVVVDRVGPRDDDAPLVPATVGSGGRGGGATAARPRVGVTRPDRPSGEAGGGVRAAHPVTGLRGKAPEQGGDAGRGAARVVRPRPAHPQADGRSGDERSAPSVGRRGDTPQRPARVLPRTDAGSGETRERAGEGRSRDSGEGARRARPRTAEPRDDGGGDRVTLGWPRVSTTPQRPQEPPPDPRVGRSPRDGSLGPGDQRTDPPRLRQPPVDLRSSPRFRDRPGSATGSPQASPRSRTTPSLRDLPGGDRPSAAPRRDRAGSPESPARRVLQGVRSARPPASSRRPSSPTVRERGVERRSLPSAGSAPSGPSRRSPSAGARSGSRSPSSRSPSSRSSAGSGRRDAGGRSSAASQGSSSRSSGSSGRAARTRGSRSGESKRDDGR